MSAGQVTLQFSTTVNSIANRYSILIRRICHSPFSHVDMVLPDGNLLGASDSPDTPVVEGNPRGVAVRPPDYEEFGFRCQAIIETPAADDIIAAARSQLGKPFDDGALDAFLSAFDVATVDDWRDPDSWFCSELMAWSLEKGNYWGEPLLWPKNRVSPTDLILTIQMDQHFINRKTFWNGVPGVKLGSNGK